MVKDDLTKASTYTADFETTGKPNLDEYGYVRVFLWSLTKIDSKEQWVGTDIEGFLITIENLNAHRVYFHNLDFDGQFLLAYFAKKYESYGEDLNMYVDVVARNNNMLAITYKPHSEYKVQFRCSFNKSLMSVQQIGEMLEDEDRAKGVKNPDWLKLDASNDRGAKPWEFLIEDDYIPSNDFIEYCKKDSLITAEYMEREYDAGRRKLTIAAESFNACVNYINGGSNFSPYSTYNKTYPSLSPEQHEFCNSAYRGGVCQVGEFHRHKEGDEPLVNVQVYDVNSMYPWVMTSFELPVGHGKFVKDAPSGLYVVRFDTDFHVKEGYVPTIQLKNSGRFGQSEYIKSSDGIITLTLTNIDYEVFKEHYDVYCEVNHQYLSFNSVKPEDSLMSEFIHEQMRKRAEHDKIESPYWNKVYKDTANMAYGAQGLTNEKQTTTIDVDKHGIVRLIREYEIDKGRHMVSACFITAYARREMFRVIQLNYPNFIYCDTDSVHLTADPVGLDIGKGLGKWSKEGGGPNNDFPIPFGKYLRPKTYAHAGYFGKVYKSYNKYGKLQSGFTCAGMTDEIKENLKFEDFEIGLKVHGKKSKKICPGGCIIEERVFTLYDTNYN